MNKKLFIILTFALLLIPLASAWDWDNIMEVTKTDAKYSELKVVNAIGLGKDLAKLELISNTEQCLIDCSAVIKITLFEDGVLPLNFDFKDGSSKTKSIPYDYYVQIKTTEDIIVPHYITDEKTCTAVKDTALRNCKEINDYNKTEKRTATEWQRYKGQIMKAEEYITKIEGRKGIGDRVDWGFDYIGISSDVIRKQWAWWDANWLKKKQITNLTTDYIILNVSYDSDMQADFDDLRFTNSVEAIEMKYWIESKINSASAIVRVNITGQSSIYMYYGNAGASTTSSISGLYGANLDAMYDFEQASAGALTDMATGNNNGTNHGATASATGKFGGAWDFERDTSQYVDAGQSTIDYTSQPYSVIGWGNLESLGTFTLGFFSGDTNGYGSYSTTGKMSYGKIAISHHESTVAMVSAGTWAMYGWIRNASDIGWYQDGTLRQAKAIADTYSAGVNYSIGGCLADPTGTWDGLLDDIMIFNRVLSNDEVRRIYNTTYNTGVFGIEESGATTMTITSILISPTTNTNYTVKNVTLVANGTIEYGNMTNITFRAWSSIGSIINTTTNSMTGTTVNQSTLNMYFVSDGLYNWSAYICGVNSTSTLCAWGINRTFRIDTAAPNINITYPQAINYNANVSELNYTILDLGVGLSSCWYSLDLGATNVTLTCGDNATDLTSLERSNTWTVWANDTLGNLNYSSITFSADWITPNLLIESPLNISYNTKNVLVNLSGSCKTTYNSSIHLDSVNGIYRSAPWEYCTNITYIGCSRMNITVSVGYGGSDGILPYATVRIRNSNGTLLEEINDTDLDTKVISENIYTTGLYSICARNGNSTAPYGTLMWDQRRDKPRLPAYCFEAALGCAGDEDVGPIVTLSPEIFYDTDLVWWNNGSNNFTYTSPVFHMFNENENILFAYANDTYNNVNSSSIYFSIDTIAPIISIVYPETLNYSTNISELNYTYSDVNSGNCWYSINNGTTNSSIEVAKTNFTKITSTEGDNIWTLYCNDSLGNENSTFITFFKDTIYPKISYGIRTENDGVFKSQNNIYINTSWTETNFKNITFVIWGVDSSSITYSSISYLHNFTSLAEGLYYYNVTLTDIVNNVNQTETRNITLDTTSPVITINSPTGDQGLQSLPYNVVLNATITDINLDSCWYNSTINATLTYYTCNENQIISISNPYTNTIYVYANDSAGNIDFASTDITLTAYENSISYETPVLSGFATTITANFIIMHPLTSAALVYNNTLYVPSVTNYGTDEYIISATVLAPIVTVDTEVPLYFILNVGGSLVNSSQHNQSVLSLTISNNCSGGNFLFMNVSNYDEENFHIINGTIEYYVSLLNSNQEITQIFGNVTTSNLICTNKNISNSTLSLNLQLRYYADDYAFETYNIQDAPASELPFVIDLYFINNTQGTRFNIYYTDFNYLMHPGAIIQVQRQYLSQNLFLPVEIPIIASDGSSVASFNTDNIKYKLIVIEDGEIIDIFENVFPACQSIVLNTCNLNLRGTETQVTASTLDFEYTLTQTNTSLTLTYIIPSGVPKLITFSTNQNSRFLNNISSCSHSIFSSGGTITCGYNYTIGDSLIATEVSSNHMPTLYGQVMVAEDLSGFYLLNNYVIAFILMLALGLIFISSGVMMVLVSVIGILFLGLIFLIKGASLTTVSTSIIWFVIAAVIIIYKISQKEERT